MVPKKYCFKTQIHVQMMVRRIMYRINYANVDETFFYTVGTVGIHSEEYIVDMTIFYIGGPGSTLVELPMHNEFSGLARVPPGSATVH